MFVGEHEADAADGGADRLVGGLRFVVLPLVVGPVDAGAGEAVAALDVLPSTSEGIAVAVEESLFGIVAGERRVYRCASVLQGVLSCAFRCGFPGPAPGRRSRARPEGALAQATMAECAADRRRGSRNDGSGDSCERDVVDGLAGRGIEMHGKVAQKWGFAENGAGGAHRFATLYRLIHEVHGRGQGHGGGRTLKRKEFEKLVAGTVYLRTLVAAGRCATGRTTSRISTGLIGPT